MAVAPPDAPPAPPDGATGDPRIPILTPEMLAALPHDNMGPTVLIVTWVMTAIASIFLALRLYCKISINRRIWWDDSILLASYICLLVQACITTFLVSVGYGLHIWDFPKENFAPWFLMPITVRGTFSLVALTWSKTAFGVTLLRLTTGWMRHVVWFIIITVNITLGLSALMGWLQCKPLNAAWDPSVIGDCWDRDIMKNYNIFSGAYSGAMDFALALLPWKLLMGLQMRRAEKIGAATAMSMGILAGIAAVVKTVNVPKLYGSDIYDSAQLMIWDTVEAAITIVAASIPVLRVLLKTISTSMRKGSSNNGGYSFSKSSRSNPKSNFSGKGNTDFSHGGADSRSDRSILGEKEIKRVDVVEVKYASRRGESYEMDHV
ncbi:hypothetical protein QBC34DRAFT_307414 [Podospora aff. communis PSN243]|uniref:Rhodopsin domain-containing protein n=1 Tax=Podospora aff. communis PSN243 TaxID=3040156 RepID=A0AAV9GAQ9_9PEZI|nr:hypothetical protein QBC34DRAFT_307414 [Podospora aff. communis PSN243]